MRPAAEDYVRPVLTATEGRPARNRSWRFRAVVALVVLAIAVGVAFAVRALTASGEQNPDVGTLPAPAPVTATS